MKRILYTLCFIAMVNSLIISQSSVGIGTTNPNASSILDVSSTTKGILLPSMTTAQRNAIVSPATGLQILNLDDFCTDIFDGSNWVKNCGMKITGTDTMPDAWTQKLNFGGVARQRGISFTIGAKGYVGTGIFGANVRSDIWEYDPATNIWTQKANIPIGRTDAVAISLLSNGETRGYVGTGSNSPGYDWWEYTASTNSWVQKPDFLGAPRYNAVAFTMNGNAYVGGGIDMFSGNWRKDFFVFQPPNSWGPIPDFPYETHSGTSFTANNNGYVGTGWKKGVLPPFFPDVVVSTMYRWDGSNWIQVADVPGVARQNAVGFSINDKGYIGTGSSEAGALKNDVWEYNPATNSWTQKANFGGTARQNAVGLAIGSKGYIGTGNDGADKQDFWEFDPYPLGNIYNAPSSPPPTYSVNDGMWTKELTKMYNNNSGNIGIGTSNPSTKLEVAGTFKVTGNVSMTGNILPPLKFDNSIINRKLELYEIANNEHQYFGFGINSNAMRYQVGGISDSHIFYAGTSSTISTELMRIQGNGNVGIGISPANNKLDIQKGNGRTGSHASGLPLYVTGDILAASNGIEFRHENGSQGIGFGFNTIYATGSSADQDLNFAARGLGNLTFKTFLFERMRITGDGFIGFGTSTPHAFMQMGNQIANRKFVLYETYDNDHEFFGFGINPNALRYQVGGTTADHIFYASTSSTTSDELFRIRGTGNVVVKGVIENEGFIAMSLLNGFQNYGAGYSTAAYYKDKEGRVHLRGLIKLYSNQNGLVIFTLPVGYRPSTSGNLLLPTIAESGPSRIDIFPDGTMQVSAGSSGWITLDGISFRAD